LSTGHSRGDYQGIIVVKYLLLRSNSFMVAARKITQKDPQLTANLKETLELLSEDVFSPRLKTHKLKGRLKGSLACSLGYNMGIVFKFVTYKDAEAILLETIGTHDEVY
jgi:mRNA interferase YafQ